MLFEHFAKEFLEKHRLDVKTNPRSAFRLRVGCERVGFGVLLAECKSMVFHTLQVLFSISFFGWLYPVACGSWCMSHTLSVRGPYVLCGIIGNWPLVPTLLLLKILFYGSLVAKTGNNTKAALLSCNTVECKLG